MVEAYRMETGPVIRHRFAAAISVFVLFMGCGAVAEGRYYPHRALSSYLLWGAEAVAGIAGAALGTTGFGRRRSRGLAATTATVVIALVCTYHGSVAASAERLATIVGSMLNLFGVLVPWGWVAQTLAVTGALGSYACAATHLTASESLMFPFIVLSAAATTSVCAAVFLERHRFEAFRRTALQTEEAEISAVLAHVTETLSRRLGDEGLLLEVNRLAVDALACDFSTLFLLDDRRGAFQMASSAGGSPAVTAELAAVEFAPDSLPLFAHFRAGAVIEIADAAAQTFIPPGLLARLRTASVMFAPIARGDRIVAVLAVGYTHRGGPFSSRQRRLALGIAHATAVALENTRLVADLQAANRLKSEFVATMSHELRTPINVIMGYAQMLAEGAVPRDDEAGFGDMLARIQRSARELLDLVAATLDMGRLESGRETVAYVEVELDAVLAGVVRELEPLVPDGVVLTWRSEVENARIVTDPSKLKTILKNLVGNALKFTTAGTVAVGARLDDGALVVSVRDTGIGIGADDLPVIFEMFRQVDSSSTRLYGGVGLGLHIARRLVELLGGEISVASALGTGSTFTIALPLRLPVEREPACPSAA